MLHNPVRYLARVVIEFTTPFIIGGGNDFIADDCFVADANGLPLLPGSSLAGVLRHEYERRNAGKARNLFGWQEKADGEGSRLSVSCGCIHNGEDIPIEGRLPNAVIQRDPVLKHSLQSVPRDHVRMTDRGTAANSGKFDEKAVAAGNRFTFELMLEGNRDDDKSWNELLTILALPELRIGGKTRRGFGAFKVISATTNCFDLGDGKDGFAAFSKYPVELSAKVSGTPVQLKPSSRALIATVTITPEAFWMFGGGGADNKADMNPVKESRIIWVNGKGSVGQPQFYVPASSVKGALSHRAAFHYNSEQKVFADDKVVSLDQASGENNKAVQELFGYCKENDDGRRGNILINDLFIDTDTQQKILNHVSIDRFTGGARDGFLFSEQPLYQGEQFRLELIVADTDGVSVEARTAFKRALDDLLEGRLPLGAGAGRGNGFFNGNVKWSDEGKWIGGEAC